MWNLNVSRWTFKMRLYFSFGSIFHQLLVFPQWLPWCKRRQKETSVLAVVPPTDSHSFVLPVGQTLTVRLFCCLSSTINLCSLLSLSEISGVTDRRFTVTTDSREVFNVSTASCWKESWQRGDVTCNPNLKGIMCSYQFHCSPSSCLKTHI